MSFNDDDTTLLEDINGLQERKNLRTILNRGKMDKWELEEFMSGEI